MGKGKLFLVSTPIGNLEDITFRALKTLQEVSLIAAEDTRRVRKILSRYNISNRVTSYHQHSELPKGKKILTELMRGADVALVSDAGTPGISDPGYRLVKSALEEDVEVVPIPGPNAAVTALSISGLPTDSFFYGGFLPPKKGERRRKLRLYQNHTSTLIFHESPHRLISTLEDLYEVLGDRRMAIARELTKIHEEVWRGQLKDLMDNIDKLTLRGEFTLVIEGKAKRPQVAPLEAATIKDDYQRLREESGLSQKEAMKQIARERGISKSEVYKAIVKE